MLPTEFAICNGWSYLRSERHSIPLCYVMFVRRFSGRDTERRRTADSDIALSAASTTNAYVLATDIR